MPRRKSDSRGHEQAGKAGDAGRPQQEGVEASGADLPESSRDESLAKSRRRRPIGRVLIVESDCGSRAALTSLLQDRSLACDSVRTLAEAMDAVSIATYDAAIVDLHLSDGEGMELVRSLRAGGLHTRCIALAEAPGLEDVLTAVRAGAVDVIPRPVNQSELLASVMTAVDDGRRQLRLERRVKRLKKQCNRLRSDRHKNTDEVNVLCNDLMGAYEDLAERVTQMSVASEFAALIRRELDLEDLLRSSLEYMLNKTGPTNIAVFLPSNHCDFSLGAYVNYDCPKDAAEVLLEHLADVLAPRFQNEPEMVRIEGAEALEEQLGADANWLADSTLMVYSCRSGDECLGVLALFRDAATPYSEDVASQVRTMGDLLGRQLERVIKIHHRHHPGDSWHIWDEDDDAEEDDYGMAA